METISAVVECIDEKYFLKIKSGDGDISIPMSEDKPIEVKKAFNDLIKRIRAGDFQVAMEDAQKEDLFSLVANEYVAQLNREIQEVRSEMMANGLIKDEKESPN